MMGKLIVVEGTDCSGKETQTRKLIERLNNENIPTQRLSYPMYDTPTGRIIGACYLGKDYLCQEYFKENKPWFEDASKVDPYTASLYYAADRKYNNYLIEELLNKGTNVILDRYVDSNLAHQGGKYTNEEEQLKFFNDIEYLEYNINKIKKPDMTLFLYMPYDYALELKKHRNELPDAHEKSKEHLLNAEKTYLRLAQLHDYNTINCVKDNTIRSIEDINEEVYQKVKKLIK